MTRARGVAWASLGLAVTACARPIVAPPPMASGPTFLLVSAGQPCPGTDQQDVTRVVADDAGRIARLVEASGAWQVRRLPAGASARELEAWVRSADGPLWLYFGGHGQRDADKRSRLCMGQGDTLLVDDLLAAIPPRVPSAVLMLNACRSASVDLRRAGAKPVTVISSATEKVENLYPSPADSQRPSPCHLERDITWHRSVFGKALEDLLARSFDENCDGLATDREMFEQMKAATVPCVWLGASMRLRSSAWSDIPLLPTRREATSCQACREGARARRPETDLLRSFIDPEGKLDRAAHARMIAVPHVVARFAHGVPPQRAPSPGIEVHTLVDPTWREANALGALTPLRMLAMFDSGPTAGDPCLSAKWYLVPRELATHVADVLAPERVGNQLRFAIGGPAGTSVVAGIPADALRAVFCPYDFDTGQCFDIAQP